MKTCSFFILHQINFIYILISQKHISRRREDGSKCNAISAYDIGGEPEAV